MSQESEDTSNNVRSQNPPSTSFCHPFSAFQPAPWSIPSSSRFMPPTIPAPILPPTTTSMYSTMHPPTNDNTSIMNNNTNTNISNVDGNNIYQTYVPAEHFTPFLQYFPGVFNLRLATVADNPSPQQQSTFSADNNNNSSQQRCLNPFSEAFPIMRRLQLVPNPASPIPIVDTPAIGQPMQEFRQVQAAPIPHNLYNPTTGYHNAAQILPPLVSNQTPDFLRSIEQQITWARDPASYFADMAHHYFEHVKTISSNITLMSSSQSQTEDLMIQREAENQAESPSCQPRQPRKKRADQQPKVKKKQKQEKQHKLPQQKDSKQQKQCKRQQEEETQQEQQRLEKHELQQQQQQQTAELQLEQQQRQQDEKSELDQQQKKEELQLHQELQQQQRGQEPEKQQELPQHHELWQQQQNEQEHQQQNDIDSINEKKEFNLLSTTQHHVVPDPTTLPNKEATPKRALKRTSSGFSFDSPPSKSPAINSQFKNDQLKIIVPSSTHLVIDQYPSTGNELPSKTAVQHLLTLSPHYGTENSCESRELNESGIEETGDCNDLQHVRRSNVADMINQRTTGTPLRTIQDCSSETALLICGESAPTVSTTTCTKYISIPDFPHAPGIPERIADNMKILPTTSTLCSVQQQQPAAEKHNLDSGISSIEIISSSDKGEETATTDQTVNSEIITMPSTTATATTNLMLSSLKVLDNIDNHLDEEPKASSSSIENTACNPLTTAPQSQRSTVMAGTIENLEVVPNVATACNSNPSYAQQLSIIPLTQQFGASPHLAPQLLTMPFITPSSLQHHPVPQVSSQGPQHYIPYQLVQASTPTVIPSAVKLCPESYSGYSLTADGIIIGPDGRPMPPSVYNYLSTAQQRTGNSNVNADELCNVCGDRSTGNHYGVRSCEGCKGFFRRTVQRKFSYTCYKQGDCNISLKTRNRCQLCRFTKCVGVGMRQELVRLERIRRKKINDNKEDEDYEELVKLKSLIVRAYQKAFPSTLKIENRADAVEQMHVFLSYIPFLAKIHENDRDIIINNATEIALVLRTLFTAENYESIVGDRSRALAEVEAGLGFSVEETELALLTTLYSLYCTNRMREPLKLRKFATQVVNCLRIHLTSNGDRNTHKVVGGFLVKIGMLLSHINTGRS